MTLIEKLTNIANAIRSKTLSTSKMKLEEMATAISKLDVVIDGIGNTTTFSSDNSITTNYIDGRTETTAFDSDGSVTTRYYKGGTLLKTEKNIFNADGSISLYVDGSLKYKQTVTSTKDSISTTYEVI